MAEWKLTVFFNDPTYTLGWTENYWWEGDTWASGLTVLSGYFPLRTACLMDTSYIVALRVCNVDSQRDSLFAAVSTTGGKGQIDHTLHPPAGLGDCLLMRREDNQTYSFFNKLFMQSVPAEIFNGRQLADPIPAFFATPLAALQAYVLDPTKGFLVRKATKPPVAPGFVYKPLSFFGPEYRTNRKQGRPFEALRGRRAIA